MSQIIIIIVRLQDLTLSIIMKVIEKESVFRCGSLFHAINEIGN
jgi:hypothetical protein